MISGITEWIFFLIVVIIVLVFGAKQIPKLAYAAGRARKYYREGLKRPLTEEELKKAIEEGEEEEE